MAQDGLLDAFDTAAGERNELLRIMKILYYAIIPGLTRNPATLVFRCRAKSLDSGFRRYDNLKRLFLIILFLLFTSGCALPRIIVLTDPLSAEEHLNLGVSYEKSGELDYAKREYKLALKKEKSARAYVYLANAFFLSREYDDAEENYRKAIKKAKGPEAADAYNNLAWLLYTRNKDLKEAQGLCEEALRLNPGKEEIYRDTLEKIRESLAKAEAEPPRKN
jgi:tetratricopeptide (TPR) repeat protein